MTKTHMSAGRLGAATLLGASIMIAAVPAMAEEWSDTNIGIRYGTQFGEPYDPDTIKKVIVSFEHVGGYKYGTNYFNVDLLMSDSNDSGGGGRNPNAGAQEAYLVYRNRVDLGKATGGDFKAGIMRGLGVTVGFDWNTKNDFYSSRKRMFVAGPTVMLDVPGFLDISLLALDESNAPDGINGRYAYTVHAALSAAWGIPLGTSPFNFQGYALYIDAKGKNEFGGDSKAEINIDAAIMMDLGRVLGGSKNTFKVGLEYQYWRNKFGNDASVPFSAGGAGNGAFAKTPMIRAEYHF